MCPAGTTPPNPWKQLIDLYTAIEEAAQTGSLDQVLEQLAEHRPVVDKAREVQQVLES